jgi:hypothetical protein
LGHMSKIAIETSLNVDAKKQGWSDIKYMNSIVISHLIRELDFYKKMSLISSVSSVLLFAVTAFVLYR